MLFSAQVHSVKRIYIWSSMKIENCPNKKINEIMKESLGDITSFLNNHLLGLVAKLPDDDEIKCKVADSILAAVILTFLEERVSSLPIIEKVEYVSVFMNDVRDIGLQSIGEWSKND